MTDEIPTTTAPPGAPPPALSEDTRAYYEGQINHLRQRAERPSASVADREHYEVMKRTYGDFLAATGYQPPPADERSPAQHLHDQRYGVEPQSASGYTIDGPQSAPAAEALAAVSMPRWMAEPIGRDMAGAPADPATVAAALGDRYGALLADAKGLLARSASTIKAETLSAYALTQLSIWKSHLDRHNASRPK